MAYTSEIEYEAPAAKTRSPHRNWLLLFLLFFMLGTVIAAIGWFAEWQRLITPINLYRYSILITVVGHALQVIGAFGMLLTPDYVEREEEANT